MSRFKALTKLPKEVLLIWKRSLTVRVLLTAVSLSVIVATSVSMFAITQVRDGLVAERRANSISQATIGLVSAIRVVNSLPTAQTSADRMSMVDAVVAAVAAPAGTSGEFEVLLLATAGEVVAGSPERGTNQIADQSVTENIRKTVVAEGAQVLQFGTLQYLDGHVEPGIVIGSPINLPGIGEYELYQLFPLADEVATLSLMSSSIAVAGLLMVIALIGTSWLLTRQVVRPIRQAAQSAERLRSGRLTERLAVRGEDDLAKLANSFNSMAISLQEQIRRLENLSRVQQRFVSDVSHELRTPLTTIRMASELLYASSENLDPSSARAVELLQQQSERFETLLNDLLEISRLDAGAVKLEIDEVDIEALIHRVIDGLENVSEKQQVKIQTIISPSVGSVSCDVRRIDRIVRNLIANAIEHAPNSVLKIAAAGDENAIAIVVRDLGSGLQPGEAALVFNRFWRADPSRQRTIGGTGLGLSISLEDARIHGGWLEADGEPGKGASFRLVLPRVSGGDVLQAPLPLSLEEIDAWLQENE
ncbi:MAG: hypothetical protein RLZZ426_610 [Actinomycetota bacterium]|jgi:two-component system sensor histidine kinase MtrB